MLISTRLCISMDIYEDSNGRGRSLTRKPTIHHFLAIVIASCQSRSVQLPWTIQFHLSLTGQAYTTEGIDTTVHVNRKPVSDPSGLLSFGGASYSAQQSSVSPNPTIVFVFAICTVVCAGVSSAKHPNHHPTASTIYSDWSVSQPASLSFTLCRGSECNVDIFNQRAPCQDDEMGWFL